MSCVSFSATSILLIAIQPNHVKALVNKGVALGNLGNYTEALQYFDKALAIQPKSYKKGGLSAYRP
jgi:tetratricopeptide (TPR) repeat protein